MHFFYLSQNKKGNYVQIAEKYTLTIHSSNRLLTC